jgi:hypothetical protein
LATRRFKTGPTSLSLHDLCQGSMTEKLLGSDSLEYLFGLHGEALGYFG